MLKFQTVAEKTVNNFRGLLFFATPCIWPTDIIPVLTVIMQKALNINCRCTVDSKVVFLANHTSVTVELLSL